MFYKHFLNHKSPRALHNTHTVLLSLLQSLLDLCDLTGVAAHSRSGVGMVKQPSKVSPAHSLQVVHRHLGHKREQLPRGGGGGRILRHYKKITSYAINTTSYKLQAKKIFILEKMVLLCGNTPLLVHYNL